MEEDSTLGLPSFGNIEYSTRSYVEMPQSGEVNYISTILGVRGNPVYKGKGIWVSNTHQANSSTIKVDKDDIRAKRHYVKTLMKDGKEVKIWECGLCGKEFKFQYTLVRHIPTHTDVRNYQCDMCPKAFRQLSTLAQHKATHLNMRPFTCDFCKKSFNRISTLISHKKIHYDEKRHVCPYCGKGFHQKGNLRNHMYTHTNERPYKCDVCHKGFNQKSNLVCHKISTHARKILHQCDVCNLNFTKPSLYSSHMESVHNVVVKLSKKKDSTHLFRHSLEDDAQCALIDESNNIIYRIPIAQGIKILKNDKNINGFESANQINISKGKNFPIVSTVIQKKDNNGRLQTLLLPVGLRPQIVESYEGANGQNVFSYYNKIGKNVNECPNDENVTSILPDLSDKENDSGLENRNSNKRTAVIYTKTQPNVRCSKNYSDPEEQSEFDHDNDSPLLDILSNHELNDPMAEDLLSSDGIQHKVNDDESQFNYVFLPEKSLNKNLDNIFIKDANDNYSIDPQWTNSGLNKENINIYTRPTGSNEVPLSNYDQMKENNFQANFGCGFLDFEEEFNQYNKEVSNIDTVENKIGKGNIKNEVIEPQNNIMADSSCCDIEPTLFNNLEPLKDSISKYNIDFDGDAFDLFDDCGFSESLWII
ncbi:hypothetical protein O3M35_007459 [Rhynocoris fuscipes]|uniref:C2H2-type domain-containing protein n=1 Tax=Rhynocoris fuscipes TaxID=488301 RepID=A0AAW1DES8_9HEMI